MSKSIKPKKATCGCGSHIAVGIKVYERAAIICGRCDKEFEFDGLSNIEKLAVDRKRGNKAGNDTKFFNKKIFNVRHVDRECVENWYSCVEILDNFDEIRIGSMVRLVGNVMRVVSVAKRTKPMHGGIVLLVEPRDKVDLTDIRANTNADSASTALDTNLSLDINLNVSNERAICASMTEG